MKRILSIALVCSIYSSLFAQDLELGVFGGASTYNGDLTQQYFDPKVIHSSFGIFTELHLSSHFSSNLMARKATISGDDAYSGNEAFMMRNLSFRSDIYELQLTGRWYPFGFDPINQKVSTYLFTGLTLFHFNPKAEYQGDWVSLQLLHTEGQGTSAFPDRQPYRLTQLAVPIGGGIKWNITRDFALAFEGNLQVTFTDYLDDVSTTYVDPSLMLSELGSLSYALSNRSGEYNGGEPLPKGNGDQRGNPDVNDYYGYFGVTLSYVFPSGIIYSIAEKRADIGCRP